MAFSKKTYTSGQTTITADNLNAIQDELIRVGGAGTLPVADYVVEQGTSGIWTYRKWNSGIAECWITSSRNVSGSPSIIIDTAHYMRVTWTDFPSIFSEAPRGWGSGRLGTGLGWLTVVPNSKTSIDIFIWGNQDSSDGVIESLMLIGNWK